MFLKNIETFLVDTIGILLQDQFNASHVVSYLTCKRVSVGQSEGLSIPRSSVRFRLKPDNSNAHEFELHRPSNKGTKLLLKVIKAIIIINSFFFQKELQLVTFWLLNHCLYGTKK